MWDEGCWEWRYRRRRRERPKRQCMDVVREDMRVKGVVEETAEDRVMWWTRMRCGDPE